jgi:hypothetical protein
MNIYLEVLHPPLLNDEYMGIIIIVSTALNYLFVLFKCPVIMLPPMTQSIVSNIQPIFQVPIQIHLHPTCLMVHCPHLWYLGCIPVHLGIQGHSYSHQGRIDHSHWRVQETWRHEGVEPQQGFWQHCKE